MAIINFTLSTGSYTIANREVTVKKDDCKELGNYQKYIHVIKKPHPMSELQIWNDTKTIILYLPDEYESNYILFLVFYVRNNDPDRPLIVEIWTQDHNVSRYSYSEMVEKNYGFITDLKKLGNDVAKELKDELYKIGERLKFIVDKAEDYKDVKVEKEPTEDKNFVMFTHSPQCEFKSSILTCSNKCNLTEYLPNDYDSKTLKAIVVYFHVRDTKFKVPLLVALEAINKNYSLHLEYWSFDGMDEMRKKYSILASSKKSAIEDVKAIYKTYEKEINRLINKEDDNEEEETMGGKKETGSTEESNELYENHYSLKSGSKRHKGDKNEHGIGFVGVVILVFLTFFLVGGLVTVTAYKYYKKYKGYYGRY